MKSRMALAALALALPLSAQAEFNYEYIEGGYLRLEPDGFSGSGDGLGIRGSAGISENFFVLGEITSSDLDDVDVEFDTYSAGLGIHVPFNDRVDVVGSASWMRIDVDVDTPVGSFDSEDDGFRLDLGLRGRISPAFELNGGIRHTDVTDDDETTGYLRGLFGSGQIRLLLEAEAGDDGELYLIGGRFDF